MADVSERRLNRSYETLKAEHADRVDVPEDRKFIGFDGYKHAMDCLKPGDVAIFTTPLAFRWVHFAYAVEKGLNVFMEKPLIADGPSAKKMYQLAEESEKKNMKVGVGLMSRHSKPLQELHDRIQDGEIGDIISDARLSDGRAARVSVFRRSGRASRASSSGRSGVSTVSFGRAAVVSATFTFITSIIVAG